MRKYLLLVFLCFSNFLATLNVLAAPQFTSQSQETTEFEKTVASLFEKNDFHELERVVSSLRTATGRFQTGTAKLKYYYWGLERGTPKIQDLYRSYDDYSGVIKNWINTFPHSSTPKIALANALASRGYSNRSSSNLERGQRDLENALEILGVAIKYGDNDPELLRCMMVIARELGRPLNEIEDLFAQGVKRMPSYEQLYITMIETMRYRMPDWQKQVEPFLSKRANSLALDEGHILYAMVARKLSYEVKQNIFNELGFNWTRVNQGLSILQQRFPSSYNLHHHLRLATLAGDMTTAKKLYANVGTDWSEDAQAVWQHQAAFQRLVLTLRNDKSTSAEQSLHALAKQGDVAGVERELNYGVDINVQNLDGDTALMSALSSGHQDLALLLIEKGADISKPRYDGTAPIDMAARRSLHSIVNLMLKRGVDIKHKNAEGWTTLHHATFGNARTVISTLLSQASIDANQLTNAGYSALDIAIDRRLIDAGEELLLSPKVTVSASGPEGWFPLRLAAYRGASRLVTALLLRGADPNQKSEKGLNTALHVAAQEGHSDVAKALLSDKRTDLNSKNSSGRTPLYEAVGGDSIDLVTTLIEGGADLNISNENGWSPLHRASGLGKVEMVRLLLAKGAKVDLKNSEGFTALDLAQANKRSEVIELLKG